MGEKRKVYRLLLAKPKKKSLLRRPRSRWADNINIDLVEREWGRVDWISLAQDGENWRALLNAVMNFGFHKMLGNYCVAVELVAYLVTLSSSNLVSLVN
jgi:hypothetical protein